jgi:hypothetical protein
VFTCSWTANIFDVFAPVILLKLIDSDDDYEYGRRGPGRAGGGGLEDGRAVLMLPGALTASSIMGSVVWPGNSKVQ